MKMDKELIEMIDEFILSIENDPELTSGIKWIDEQAKKRGITFYDMCFKVLHDPDLRKWFNNTR